VKLAPVRRRLLSLLLIGQLMMAGCATVTPGSGADPRDPWEGYNRQVWRFNEALDEAVLQPVARGYKAAVPEFVRTGVGNFFGNLSDVWSLVNNLLQLKPAESAEMTARVGLNSTVGLLGLFDVATGAGLQRRREDFGHTLAHWGMPTGPYLVLPLLGPSTLRDTAALPVDMKGDLLGQVNDSSARIGLRVTRVVGQRADLLEAGRMLDQVALDRYTFVRDAHLQRRRGSSEGPEKSSQPEERYDLPEAAPPAR
jgi:phospholipid-binding lipoprotein MlaA